MTVLQDLLDSYRTAAATNREAGTYFEELTVCYFKNAVRRNGSAATSTIGGGLIASPPKPNHSQLVALAVNLAPGSSGVRLIPFAARGADAELGALQYAERRHEPCS